MYANIDYYFRTRFIISKVDIFRIGCYRPKYSNLGNFYIFLSRLLDIINMDYFLSILPLSRSMYVYSIPFSNYIVHVLIDIHNIYVHIWCLTAVTSCEYFLYCFFVYGNYVS